MGLVTADESAAGIYHGLAEGEIIFAGEEIQASHIRDTERKGIAIIHQELALVKELTVLENIFLGNEINHRQSALLLWIDLMISYAVVVACTGQYPFHLMHLRRFRAWATTTG
ncbi:hypothetical protein DJICPGNB_17775 [Escherichia coli]|nr:hypothetical protein DJICPGNB_17775 [Escherichia coli]